MQRRGWKRYGIGAGGMLVLVMAILLATGWGSAVAAQIQGVLVTNDAAHSVPVREQNLDANGNIKVHEQGTANVNVTNSSLSIAAQSPVTSGGQASELDSGENANYGTTITVSALSIWFSGGAHDLTLSNNGSIVARIPGPLGSVDAGVDLALTRPVSFDSARCGGTGGLCRFGWVGNSP
jgi:hypothetical protein